MATLSEPGQDRLASAVLLQPGTQQQHSICTWEAPGADQCGAMWLKQQQDVHMHAVTQSEHCCVQPPRGWPVFRLLCEAHACCWWRACAVVMVRGVCGRVM